MWKATILLLGCLMAAAQARPSYLPGYEQLEYAPTIVGHTVHTIPTAVSHQSQTIVHEKRPYLRPIVEHAPILHTYEPASSLGLPVAYSPLAYSGLYDHGWNPSYSPVYGGWNGWPLK